MVLFSLLCDILSLTRCVCVFFVFFSSLLLWNDLKKLVLSTRSKTVISFLFPFFTLSANCTHLWCSMFIFTIITPHIYDIHVNSVLFLYSCIRVFASLLQVLRDCFNRHTYLVWIVFTEYILLAWCRRLSSERNHHYFACILLNFWVKICVPVSAFIAVFYDNSYNEMSLIMLPMRIRFRIRVESKNLCAFDWHW